MKKKILLAILTLVVLVAVFASCGECEEHVLSAEPASVVTAPTCTTTGVGLFVCTECEEEVEGALPALGHSIDEENPEIITPTCQTDGKSVYSCTRDGCDYTEDRHPVSKNSSYCVFEDVKKDPTCIKPGSITRVCTQCGDGDGSYTRIDAKGHTYERATPVGITVQDPTCLADGIVTFDCADCDVVYTNLTAQETVDSQTSTEQAIKDAQGVLDIMAEGTYGTKTYNEYIVKLGHSYENKDVNTYIAPKCEQVGYYVYNCDRCGDDATWQDADIPALGHTFERTGFVPTDADYVITVAPTCLLLGTRVVKCTECTEQVLSDNPAHTDTQVPTIAHFTTYENVGPAIPATCTVDGYQTIKCTSGVGCQQETDISTNDPATGHDYVRNYDESKGGLAENATPGCATEGNYPYICANGCGSTTINYAGETPTDAKHTGYTVGEYVAGKEPTCTKRGWYLCTVCDNEFESYTDDTVPTAHHYTDVDDIVPSSCKREGYTVMGCVDCDAYQIVDYVARTAHTFGTLTSDGCLTCTVCNASYIDVTTVKESLEFEGGTDIGVGTVTGTGTNYPAAPTQLTANTKHTQTENASAVRLISLKGEEGTTYTITVTGIDGTLKVLSGTISGAEVYVDLYEIDLNGLGTIESIEITASTDATVSFYKVNA